MLPIEGQTDPGDIKPSSVKLKYFKADPLTILPFGSSKLSWSVQAEGDIPLRLDGLPVQNVGQKVVQPSKTQTYKLTVKDNYADPIELGSVVVMVAMEGCETLEVVPDTAGDLELKIEDAIKGNSDASLRSKPVVTFSPELQLIRLKVELGISVAGIDVIEVDISASFGLSVIDGEVIATNKRVDPNVSVLTVDIEISEHAKKEATEHTYKLINGLVGYISLAAKAQTPFQKHLHSVRIVANNINALQATYCPYPPLPSPPPDGQIPDNINDPR